MAHRELERGSRYPRRSALPFVATLTPLVYGGVPVAETKGWNIL